MNPLNKDMLLSRYGVTGYFLGTESNIFTKCRERK